MRHASGSLCLALFGQPIVLFCACFAACSPLPGAPSARAKKKAVLWHGAAGNGRSVAARPHHALLTIVVRLETSHDERSPLKDDAPRNTAASTTQPDQVSRAPHAASTTAAATTTTTTTINITDISLRMHGGHCMCHASVCEPCECVAAPSSAAAPRRAPLPTQACARKRRCRGMGQLATVAQWRQGPITHWWSY